MAAASQEPSGIPDVPRATLGSLTGGPSTITPTERSLLGMKSIELNFNRNFPILACE